MQLGVHVVQRERLSALAAAGVEVPEPWMGLLDALRMVEGHLGEPPEGQPLGLVGLEALLGAVPGEGTALLQALRTGLVEARRYFAWKRIPLVFLVPGTVDDPQDGTGLTLEHQGRRWPLAPLLGTHLVAARLATPGWWWAPQLG